MKGTRETGMGLHGGLCAENEFVRVLKKGGDGRVECVRGDKGDVRTFVFVEAVRRGPGKVKGLRKARGGFLGFGFSAGEDVIRLGLAQSGGQGHTPGAPFC